MMRWVAFAVPAGAGAFRRSANAPALAISDAIVPGVTEAGRMSRPAGEASAAKAQPRPVDPAPVRACTKGISRTICASKRQ